MPAHQHLTFAGGGSSNSVRENAASLPENTRPALRSWRPDTIRDDFWGADWSNWRPQPPPQPVRNIRPEASLLDLPVEETRLPTRRKSIRSRGNEDDTNSTSTGFTGTTTSRMRHPERKLPHELQPVILEQGPRDNTDTVERILKYIDKPPRRRRMVPDEDWLQMDTSRLRGELFKQVRIARYLVRENRRLVAKLEERRRQAPDLMRGSAAPVLFKEDEHLEAFLLIELSEGDIGQLGVETLRDNLDVVRQAREELLDTNEDMIQSVEATNEVAASFAYTR